jgi:predicted transcriptional regulator
MADSGVAKVLGPLESEVMAIVWEGDNPVTVRDVLDRLNRDRRSRLAYTTVMTVMARLAEKGVLRRSRQGRGYIYEAEADDAAGIAVRNLVRDFGESAVAQLVDEVRGNPRLLRRLEQLLAEKP